MSIENEIYEMYGDAIGVKLGTCAHPHGDIACELPMAVYSASMWEQRAARIVACVNAFAGIPTERITNVAHMLSAYKSQINGKYGKYHHYQPIDLGEVHFRDCQCDQCTSMVLKRRDCACRETSQFECLKNCVRGN